MSDLVLRTWQNRKAHLSIRGKRVSLCGMAIDFDIECSITPQQFSRMLGHCKKCELIIASIALKKSISKPFMESDKQKTHD